MQATHHKGKTREEVINDYDGFVEKFKPKLTTDDCITPEPVYEVVASYVTEKYGIQREDMVRPFWPGLDYKMMPYPVGAVVVDNPPFSILSEIIKYYQEREIAFFLFAPMLTVMNYLNGEVYPAFTAIFAHADVVYENGARVKTAFITSLDPERVVIGDPEFADRLEAAVETVRKEQVVKLPSYEYPPEVITGALVDKWTGHGTRYEVRREDAVFVRKLDAQQEKGKAIFGGGLLLSERAAAERAAAERAAAERAAAHIWKLSDRELAISRNLGGGAA